MRRDTTAASPLMVIATFVLVASGLTALLFFAFVDTAPPALSLVEAEEEGERMLRVVSEHGGMAWDDLEIRFVDPAGKDWASVYLTIPEGPVEVGDAIGYARMPPAGVHHVRVFLGERELARLAVGT